MRSGPRALSLAVSAVGPVAVGLLAAGCLAEKAPVEGRMLFGGRGIERPGFVTVGGAPAVQFEVRTAAPTPERAAVSDVWLVSWDTGEERLLIKNRSTRWEMAADASGEARYVMTDEGSVDTFAGLGTSTPVATLNKVSLVSGLLETIPNVSSFSLHGERLLYRQPVVDSSLPDLRLKEGQQDRLVGRSSGAAQVTHDGRLYAVLGEERTLVHLASVDGELDRLRANVTRFLLNNDEAHAALGISEMGKPRTVVFDLKKRSETALPVENPCCWIDLRGSEFVFAESAAGGAPARLHQFNFQTGTDQVVEMPPGLRDVVSVAGRPGGPEVLLFDSQGRVALWQPGEGAAIRLLEHRMVSPSFTSDGTHILYVEPDPNSVSVTIEGRLMIQEATFTDPPRQISPRGAFVPERGYFFLPADDRPVLVFWAHYGRSASDLYFGDHETLESRLVAQGISDVTVTIRQLVGVVRVSQQDLVGDLVDKDLSAGEEVVLARSVSDLAVWGSRIAFTVRGRVPSRWDGLWGTELE